MMQGWKKEGWQAKQEKKAKISAAREGQLPQTCSMTTQESRWKERMEREERKENEAKEGAQTDRVTQTATCCCARARSMDERGLV